jgi:hypothetical protein
VNRSRWRKLYIRFNIGIRTRTKLQEFQASVPPLLFTIFLELPLHSFKAHRPDSSVLEGVFNYTNRKRLLSYSREIAKEALDIIFWLIGANRIHDINLLVVFPLPENTYIARLK